MDISHHGVLEYFRVCGHRESVLWQWESCVKVVWKSAQVLPHHGLVSSVNTFKPLVPNFWERVVWLSRRSIRCLFKPQALKLCKMQWKWTLIVWYEKCLFIATTTLEGAKDLSQLFLSSLYASDHSITET